MDLFLQKVELHILDMSRPRDVVKFAQDFVSSGKPLDVLVSLWYVQVCASACECVFVCMFVQVNNAGVMNTTRQVDADGIESNFCVNTLGNGVEPDECKPLHS